MIKIALLDDHIILFEAIQFVLKKKPKYSFIRGFTDFKEIKDYLYEGNTIDILLLDIQIEKNDGLEYCEKIKKLDPNLKIIIFTSYISKALIIKALANGASGYMVKNISSEELINGIEIVLQNKIYLHEKVSHFFAPEKKVYDDYFPKLTKREIEILKLIMEELTSKQIAQRLFISVNTVETHRANLFTKTGAKNVAGLITIALEKNLLNN